jgi:hypothetical protein
MAIGKKTGGGSRKGVPNKTTGAVKEMILAALDSVGGAEYLAERARANPSAFMTLVGKVLPLQLQGDRENPVQVNLTEDERERRVTEMLSDAFAERPKGE